MVLPQQHTNLSGSSGSGRRISSLYGCFIAVVVLFQVAVFRSYTITSRLVPAQVENKDAYPTIDSASIHRDGETSYSLAHKQSLGFFDDITGSNWKRAQTIHAKLFPNHFGDLKKYSSGINDQGNIPALKKSSHWNAENFQEEFHCANSQRIPTDSNGDGPKWVCDPHRLAKKKDCLVYSVGSNGNVMFETGIKNEIGDHCEIHTFDMVTSNKRNGDFAKALDGIATFHAWGLGTEEDVIKSRRPMKTLAQTMKELGHSDRRVDIFKIDCEWCEWHTYEQWLEFDLRQILVETHNAPMPNAKNFFYSLHDAGYVIFSKEANFQNGGGCVEFGFLKLSTDFFVNDTMYSKRGMA